MTPPDVAHRRLIIGLGSTGLSCARYFSHNHGESEDFALLDSRLTPPLLSTFKTEFPNVPIYLGPFDAQLLQHAKELIVSPGIDLNDPVISHAFAKTGVQPIGDIELFARKARAPYIVITGTNAKGTVTTLVADMIHAAQRTVKVGGNIGTPALHLLQGTPPDFYVLEISSFQLQTTYSLEADVATILNISPDHLDRHKTLENYVQTKHRIYQHCKTAVWNQDDSHTRPCSHAKLEQGSSFGLTQAKSTSEKFSLQRVNKKMYLSKGKQPLIAVDNLFIKGKHNWLNALAALTLGEAIQLPLPSMLAALCQFKGLKHRCQWITEEKGITWYNDSKATNVGATLAAITGLGPATRGKIILIAGGLGKGADFNLLKHSVKLYVKLAILIGQDAPRIKLALRDDTETQMACDLAQAVSLARKAASPGDAILLSPACASMDMFKNYAERGDIFMQLVQGEH